MTINKQLIREIIAAPFLAVGVPFLSLSLLILFGMSRATELIRKYGDVTEEFNRET